MTVAELAEHGDFGLGTFNALDGEMIVLDGAVYQARADGLVQPAGEEAQTPFAAVTHFQADEVTEAGEDSTCSGLQSQIDAHLPSLNAPYAIPYAIKVSGNFAFVQMRAPRQQSAPYPTLTEALADQAVFESHNISGTMVGFRLPEYLAGANAAGYHFHFISDDRQRGGHLLDCQVEAVTVEIDTTDRIYIDVSQPQD
jgi:acetolactate decarboxylase